LPPAHSRDDERMRMLVNPPPIAVHRPSASRRSLIHRDAPTHLIKSSNRVWSNQSARCLESTNHVPAPRSPVNHHRSTRASIKPGMDGCNQAGRGNMGEASTRSSLVNVIATQFGCGAKGREVVPLTCHSFGRVNVKNHTSWYL